MHLVDYEEAQGDKEKALAALVVVTRKTSKRLAWAWARTAAEHAQTAGIDNAFELIGHGRWPVTDTLETAVRALP